MAFGRKRPGGNHATGPISGLEAPISGAKRFKICQLNVIQRGEILQRKSGHLSERVIFTQDFTGTCARTEEDGLEPVTVSVESDLGESQLNHLGVSTLGNTMGVLTCRTCDLYNLSREELEEKKLRIAETRQQAAIALAAAAATESQIAKTDLENKLSQIALVDEALSEGRLTPEDADLFKAEIRAGLA